jgi:hypothetical protein
METQYACSDILLIDPYCKLSGHSGAEERGEACDIAYASIGQPTARDASLLMAEGGLYAMTACSPGLLRHSGGLSRSRRGDLSRATSTR